MYINYKRLAERANLAPDEVEHFTEGMKTQDVSRLFLNRDVYTRLQKEFELAVLGSLDRKEARGQGVFAYKTHRPLTPLLDATHPRSECVEKIFDTEDSVGISMFTQDGLESLRPEELRRFERIIKRTQSDVFSVLDPKNQDLFSEGFFVFGGWGQIPRVAFKATQLVPEENKEKGGSVLFSGDAHLLYTNAIQTHAVSKRENRGRQTILDQLDRLQQHLG